MSHRILDLFAGIGVGMAAKRLAAESLGVDNDDAVVHTRQANLLDTVYRDAWDLDAASGLDFDTMWASPPCQGISPAGDRRGSEDLRTVAHYLRHEGTGPIEKLRALEGALRDPVSATLALPLLYAMVYRPTYILMEQVVAVQPVWLAMAGQLARLGYRVTVAHVEMETYGLPQTRTRAMVIARLSRSNPLEPPTTHSYFNRRSRGRLARGAPKWVSMGEAAGIRSYFELISSYSKAGDRQNPLVRTCDEPALTVTGHVLRGRIATAAGVTGTDGLRRLALPPGRRAAVMAGDEDISPYFTVRKVALADALQWQGFPADTRLPEPAATSAQIVGNAVPPSVAEVFLSHVWREEAPSP